MSTDLIHTTADRNKKAVGRQPLSGIDRAERPFSSLLAAPHCDGALKLPGNPGGMGFADGIAGLALQTLRDDRSSLLHPGLHVASANHSALVVADPAQLADLAARNPLVFPATGAQLWIQPVSAKRLAIQWNVPGNVRRNCHDLLGGQEPSFILRLCQQVTVANGWRSAQRTLEFEVEVARRRCFIRLEQPGGVYAAELGVRLRDGRYVFLARSGECALPRLAPLPGSDAEYCSLTVPALRLPEVPECFWSAASDAPLLYGATDWAGRDTRAESWVRAVYLDFLREGPRVFRTRGSIEPLTAVRRMEMFRQRQQQAVLAAESERLEAAHLARPVMRMERLETRTAASVVETKPAVAVAPVQELRYPPMKRPEETVYNPADLTRAEALFFAPLPHLCQSENLLRVEHFNRQELAAGAGRKRRVIRVKSTSALSEAIRRAKLENKAEIILRGRVKPGRRVRVGGLLIETAEDGSFCVACVIRDGRLHVPVEEVAAVAVE